MFTNDSPGVDGEVLARYVLGELPQEEAERLDERTVTDEEFSWQVAAIENDLVDAYLRGELSRPQLARFKSYYLASPKRRQKVSLAEAMRKAESKPLAAPAKASTAAHKVSEPASSDKHSFWSLFTMLGLRLQWGFATAALAMALVAGSLLVEVNHLKTQMTGTEAERAALDKRQQETEKQLNDQRTANAQTQSELEHLRNETPKSDTTNLIAVLLMPQTRGVGQPVAISVPAGSSAIPVRLELESVAYPVYQVTLKDPASDGGLWHSPKLKVAAKGKSKLLSISLPAPLLKQQTYILEVAGIPAKGAPSMIDAYVFRVVRD